MKNIILTLTFTILGLATKAQECYQGPFTSAKIFYSTVGAGMEIGLWPTKQSILGGFIGGAFIQGKQSVYDPKYEKTIEKTIFNSVGYVKAQIRVIRYLHLTAAVGFQNKTIGSGVYREFGGKLVLPINTGRKVAFYVEPISTNNGFRTNIGFSFGLQ